MILNGVFVIQSIETNPVYSCQSLSIFCWAQNVLGQLKVDHLARFLLPLWNSNTTFFSFLIITLLGIRWTGHNIIFTSLKLKYTPGGRKCWYDSNVLSNVFVPLCGAIVSHRNTISPLVGRLTVLHHIFPLKFCRTWATVLHNFLAV